jgi:acetyl-CoA acetyltransferase
MGNMLDDAVITGIGWTDYSRNSGKSVESLAVEAAKAALADAGLAPGDADGIVTYGLLDTVATAVVATDLGMAVVNHYADYNAGGNMACGAVFSAAMAVASGQARHVVVFRALNGASGVRYGGAAFSQLLAMTSIHSDSEPQFLDSCGVTMPVQHFALLCRRHMIRHGTTPDHLAAVAMAGRSYAERNERAMMRKPMGREDYESSRMISEPFRTVDCCLQSDGACALVVSARDAAADLKRQPVRILSGATVTGPRARGGMWGNFWEDHSRSYAHYAAPRLFGSAGLKPADIDLAQLYDCFTYSALVQLEDFGFCTKGEGGPFFAQGRTRLGGDLPVNTAGGLLSEAYIHGLNLVVEAVSQLRGEAGVRQVPGAETALVSAGGATSSGSALILAKG